MYVSQYLNLKLSVLITIPFSHTVQDFVVLNCGTFQKVRAAYNNAYRCILGYSKKCSASEMLVSNSILTFECLAQKQINSFLNCINNVANDLIHTVKKNYRVQNNSMVAKKYLCDSLIFLIHTCIYLLMDVILYACFYCIIRTFFFWSNL